MPKTPSDKQLRNTAYRIASGNFLVKCFSYAEFQKIKSTNHVTETYEYWDDDALDSEISGIADLIYDALLDLKKTMKDKS